MKRIQTDHITEGTRIQTDLYTEETFKGSVLRGKRLNLYKQKGRNYLGKYIASWSRERPKHPSQGMVSNQKWFRYAGCKAVMDESLSQCSNSMMVMLYPSGLRLGTRWLRRETTTQSQSDGDTAAVDSSNLSETFTWVCWVLFLSSFSLAVLQAFD